MPYTEKQNKLFRAAEHNPDIAKRHDLTQAEAGKLAAEGVKDGQRKIRVRFKKPAAFADAEHWITLHPNGREATGTPALINGAGQIIGGAGGKLTGKIVNPKTKSEARPGTEEQHAPAIWLGSAQPEQPGNGGAVTTQPTVEQPPIDAPKPSEGPTKEPEQASDDPELKKMESKLAQAKEILEKSGKMPDFLRKEMEADIARQEKEISDYKAQKQSGPQAPEVKPEPPKIEEKPEVKAPEQAPEIEQKPKQQPENEPEIQPQPEPEPEQAPMQEPSSKMEQAGRDADKLAENVKTFEDAEAVYKKYRDAQNFAFEEKLQNTELANELRQKLMDARKVMSDKSFEFSENAKTVEDHKIGLEIHKRLHDLNKYTSMRNFHAVAYNTHLKALKKAESEKARSEKKAKKAEEKKSGVVSRESRLESRFAKASHEEIDRNFREKYGVGFMSKPNMKANEDERISIQHKLYDQATREEEKPELYRRANELRQQASDAEKYTRVRGFKPVDSNAKTASGKNARLMMAHVEETFDSLIEQGYDIKEVMRQSKVFFAAGTLNKFGGLSWQVGDTRYTTVDANKYFKAGWTDQLEEMEQKRLARGDGRWNSGSTARNTIIHEVAHSVGISESRKSPDRLSGIMEKMIPNYVDRQNWIKKNISEYATKNIKETDAELASMVLDPKYKRGTLPKELEDHVDWLFMKKGA